jgi:hypothetical protein
MYERQWNAGDCIMLRYALGLAEDMSVWLRKHVKPTTSEIEYAFDLHKFEEEEE